MTQTMKPRQMFTAARAAQITEIKVADQWHAIDGQSLTLIGSRNWTIRKAGFDGINAGDGVLVRCSGNTSFEVR